MRRPANPICQYCRKPATVWFRYQHVRVIWGRRSLKRVTIAACAEHEGSDNGGLISMFNAYRRNEPSLALERAN
jgi:hypothetical protein